jgi:fibronectin type 3 domain-containing protein
VTAQQTATITATLGASTARYTLTLYPPNAPAQHTVSLTWDAPESNGDAVAGYHIYRSAGSNTTSFAEISAQSTTSFVDTDVSGGSSYTYVVRSVDADGVESSDSNTAVVTVPAT